MRFDVQTDQTTVVHIPVTDTFVELLKSIFKNKEGGI